MDKKEIELYDIFAIILQLLFLIILVFSGINWKGKIILFFSSLLPLTFVFLYKYTNRKIYKYISIFLFILKTIGLIVLIRIMLNNYYSIKDVDEFFNEISD